MKRIPLASIGCFALHALLGSRICAQSPFVFREVGPASLELSERGKPVYVYHHGELKPEGVPPDRHRCCYIHPLYSPQGVIVTDDFPKDHYHHRGVFWAWPVVEIEGRRYDLWLIRGIRHRFLRYLAQEALADRARLEFETGWFLDADPVNPVVREHVEVLAFPVRAGQRELRFTLELTATRPGIRISGQPDGKGYGGFNMRFAPRSQTVIVTDRGREAQDSDLVPHPWAELSGQFQGGPATLRITIDPRNPGYPNGWCLRHYGFLGVNYPGLNVLELEPGKPLSLRFTVSVR